MPMKGSPLMGLITCACSSDAARTAKDAFWVALLGFAKGDGYRVRG